MAGRPRSTENMQIGQDQTFQMPATGSIYPEDFRNEFEVVDGNFGFNKAETLAFAEEPVEVVVSTTNEKHAERFPHVAVNGVNQYFERGKRMVVKRKFVEALARAKKTTIETMPAKDQDGADTMNIVQNTGLRYPFSVTRDDNPKGNAWLEKVLAEG